MRPVDYTESDMLKAIRLRAAGLTWPEIGAEMGRSHRSLQITVANYRRGLWQPKRRAAETAARSAACESLVEAGVIDLRSIAGHLGVSISGASRRLSRIGLDLEMRRLAVDTARATP